MESAEDAQALLRRNYTSGMTLNGKKAHELDIRFITHGKPQDKFWKQVKFGVKYSSNKYGVRSRFVVLLFVLSNIHRFTDLC